MHAMTTPDVLRAMLMYVILPVWLAAGFADYLCHRAAHIERTSGWKESLLHLAQFAEMGVPVLAALMLDINAGVILIKLWLEVGKEEQERRFQARINDPMRQWKLSPMDIESYTHWDDYTKARDKMFDVTDSKEAPWYIIRSDDKRRARLNCISHLLSTIPHKKIKNDKVKLPKRPKKSKYDEQRGLKGRNFVEERF